MALVDARGFQLSPNIGQQLGQGVQITGELQRQQLLQQQALADQRQAQAALDKEARLQGIFARLGAAQQPPQAPQQVLGGQSQPLPQLGQQAQPAQLGAQAAQPAQLGAQQAPQIPFGNPRAMAELAIQFPEKFEQISKNLGLITQKKRDDAGRFAFKLRNAPVDQRPAMIDQREAELRATGGDPTHTISLRGMPEEEQNQALEIVEMAALSGIQRQEVAEGTRAFGLDEKKFGLSQQEFGLAKTLAASTIAERAKPTEATAGQKEFADLTKGLTAEQKAQAKLIKLGLSPRAVGSAIQTISEQGLAEQIGDVEAIIKERAKFGELTGASRAKAIDSGFVTIRNIDKNVINLDRAIAAVEAGAGTGAIERRFPSIKAASVLLDNIQGELALDVIGAVTFGALSAGELDLAKQIALPTGLDGPQLIKHLQDKKSAQQKLRGYFNEQIQFLDQGGSVAGFLRAKERTSPIVIPETKASPSTAETAAVSPATAGQPVSQKVIKFDRTGKRI